MTRRQLRDHALDALEIGNQGVLVNHPRAA
jgi:hypothetical protein